MKLSDDAQDYLSIIVSTFLHDYVVQQYNWDALDEIQRNCFDHNSDAQNRVARAMQKAVVDDEKKVKS